MPTLLTQTGRAFIVQQLVGPTSGTATVYIGVGTGVGSATPTAVALYSEVSPRIPATLSIATTNVSGDSITTTVTIFGPLSLTNAGVFDSASGGNLFAITDFDGEVINLVTINDRLELTYTMVLL